MSDADRAKWDRFRADLDRGFEKGVLTAKGRAVVMKAKTAQETEPDKIRAKILSLKIKALQQLSHLGARVYFLMDFKGKNPGMDGSVKDITARLRRYETEIESMEKHLSAVRKKLEKTT